MEGLEEDMKEEARKFFLKMRVQLDGLNQTADRVNKT